MIIHLIIGITLSHHTTRYCHTVLHTATFLSNWAGVVFFGAMVIIITMYFSL